jgi:hypothetical protein
MIDKPKKEEKKMEHFGFRFKAKFMKSADVRKAVREINKIMKEYECFYKIVKQ